jgi:hypothetical protein
VKAFCKTSTSTKDFTQSSAEKASKAATPLFKHFSAVKKIFYIGQSTFWTETVTCHDNFIISAALSDITGAGESCSLL